MVSFTFLFILYTSFTKSIQFAVTTKIEKHSPYHGPKDLIWLCSANKTFIFAFYKTLSISRFAYVVLQTGHLSLHFTKHSPQMV